MKRRRLGIFLTMVVALMSLAVVFVGCDWFNDDDEGGGGGNGPTTAKYVVVANTGNPPYADATGATGNLSVYKIQSDGTLTFQDNVALFNGKPSMILLHPNKKFLYVANHTGDINVFSFNVDTGALTEIEGSPYNNSESVGLINLAITPDGKFLYTADSRNWETQVWAVDNTSGGLESLGSYEVAGAHGIAMHPTGKFLFIGGDLEWGNGELFAFAIDNTTGELTQVGSTLTPIIGEGYPGDWVWLQTTPDGKYLFGAGYELGGIWGIDNVTGALTELHLEDTYNSGIVNLVIAPTLPFLYVAGFDDNTISAFKANEDGSVDNVVGSPYTTGSGPKCLTVTGDSKYLYVANFDWQSKGANGSVMAYSISRSTGQLTIIGTYMTPGTFSKNLVAIP